MGERTWALESVLQSERAGGRRLRQGWAGLRAPVGTKRVPHRGVANPTPGPELSIARRRPRQGSPFPRELMSKMDDRKLLALARKNALKSVQKKPKMSPTYDDTLPPQPVDDEETQRLFQEMKKREF